MEKRVIRVLHQGALASPVDMLEARVLGDSRVCPAVCTVSCPGDVSVLVFENRRLTRGKN